MVNTRINKAKGVAPRGSSVRASARGVFAASVVSSAADTLGEMVSDRTYRSVIAWDAFDLDMLVGVALGGHPEGQEFPIAVDLGDLAEDHACIGLLPENRELVGGSDELEVRDGLQICSGSSARGMARLSIEEQYLG